MRIMLKIHNFSLILIFICAISFISGCSKNDTKTTITGLKYTETLEGTGRSAFKGMTVVINYIGTLPDGTEISNSYQTGIPLKFKIGDGSVIKGLEEGVLGMKPGGKRKLVIPPELAYGPEGGGTKIPGNTFVLFDVELVEVN